MLAYLKSRNFPIHLLAYWWILWLALSCTDLSEFVPPSAETLAQYAMLIVSFLLGHTMIKYRDELRLRVARHRRSTFYAGSLRMRLAMLGSALLCTLMLLLSLRLSGAFSESFLVYFAKLRMAGDDAVELTGIRALDVLTKIFAFPMSYTIILIVLANNVQRFRATMVLCIFNLLAFSYLWQVNYPIIHLFWFMVFYLLLQAHHRGVLMARTLMVVLLLVSTLLASAVNRFGGDVLGGLQRYVVGYHLIGFSFYDHQLQNRDSILHAHTFGRSSLGFLDQMLEAALKQTGADYKAASSENSTHNNDVVDIGAQEFKEFNAFGTLLFGFYRDFHVFGIVLGGFLYGALATHTLYGSARSWMCGALFIFLASSWMMGMMVNPLEQAYFWFAVVALCTFGLVNKGLYR